MSIVLDLRIAPGTPYPSTRRRTTETASWAASSPAARIIVAGVGLASSFIITRARYSRRVFRVPEPSLDFIRTHLDKQERWGPAGSEDTDAPIVLQRSWDADLLQATLEHVLKMTGMKGLLEAGARTAERMLTDASAAKDRADVARWEAKLAKQELAEDLAWEVRRLDDNGNEFLVSQHPSKADADARAAELEARGHKQTYWVVKSKSDGQ